MTPDKPSESDQVKPSSFWTGFATLVVRHRWVCLMVTLSLTVLMAHQAATNLKVDSRTESLIADDSPASLALAELRKEFGDDNLFLLLIEGDVFSMDYLERLRALHEELSGLDVELSVPVAADTAGPSVVAAGDTVGGGDGSPADDVFGDFGDGDEEGWGDTEGGTIFDEVTSLINVQEVSATAQDISVGGLLDVWPSVESLPGLRSRVLSDPAYVGRVVAPSGTHSVLILRTRLMDEEDTSRVFQEVRETVTKHSGAGFEIQVSGMPAVNSALSEMILSDLERLVGFAYLVIIVFLVIIFRHPWGVLGPLLVVIQAVVWTFGVMAIAGVTMTPLTNIMPVLLICAGIGDSIHVQSVYRDLRRQGVENNAAIIQATSRTAVAIFFTSVTTGLGMASFAFASLTAVQELGLLSALGVLFAMFHSIVFLPVILTFNKKSLLGSRKEREARDRFDRFLAWCDRLSRGEDASSTTRRSRNVMVLCGALVVVIGVGMSTLKVSHNALEWFPADHPIPTAMYDLDEHVGGSAHLSLLLEPKGEHGIKARELLTAIEQLEEYLLTYRSPEGDVRIVTHSFSILDLLRDSWQALNGGDQAFYKVPDTQQGIFDAFSILENSDSGDLRRLVTLDGSKANVTVRITWQDAGAYKPLQAYVAAGIDQFIGERAAVKTTGTVFTTLSVFDRVVSDLVSSFSAAFLVITLIMIVLLKNWRIGLLSMIPNLLPIAAVMAIMGLSGIPLDLNTLLVACIAIAIAVDDSIHFLHQFRLEHEATGNVNQAIAYAYSHAGRAIISTSLIIMAGFAVYLAAQMRNIQLLGVLVGMTVFFAVLADLVIAPALLRLAMGSSSRDEAVRDGAAERP